MTKDSNEFKDGGSKLTNSLINVKAIIAHFNTKIEAYATANQIVTLSEEQVLDVFRSNYDSLTLKFQDNLDQFIPYNSARQLERDFFSKILKSIIEHYANDRDSLTVGFEEQHSLVQQIQNSSALALSRTESFEESEKW